MQTTKIDPILTTDLSYITIGKRLHQVPSPSKKILTGENFAHYLFTFNSLDVLTYTYDEELFVGLSIVRLLYAKCKDKPLSNVIESRIASNIHTKMYICYGDGANEIWLGSYNLVRPTMVDLVMRTRRADEKACLQYFNQLWTQAKPYATL